MIMLSHSVMYDPWQFHGIARQAPLSMGILQARIQEWVAISFSRRIFLIQESNPVSCLALAGRFFTPEPLEKHFNLEIWLK